MTAEPTTIVDIDKKKALVRDAVRAVIQRRVNGLYLYGPPGTGKSHLVRDMLDQNGIEGIDYEWHSGFITGRALFDKLHNAFDRTVVLDDVSEIYKDRKAVQVLQAATDRNVPRKNYRVIKWGAHGKGDWFVYMGGVICISNLPIASDPISQSLRSRCSPFDYKFSQVEIEIIIRDLAESGKVPEMTQQEAIEVADFLMLEVGRRQVLLDVRRYMKAVERYKQWRAHDSETHWHDMIRADVAESLIVPQQAVSLGATPNEIIRQETLLAVEILRTFSDKGQQRTEFMRQSGASKATWHRRRSDALGIMQAQSQSQSQSQAKADVRFSAETDAEDVEPIHIPLGIRPR